MTKPLDSQPYPNEDDLEAQLGWRPTGKDDQSSAAATAKQLVVHGLLRNAADDNVRADQAVIEKVLAELRDGGTSRNTQRPKRSDSRVFGDRSLSGVGIGSLAAIAAAVLVIFGFRVQSISKPATLARLVVHNDGVTLADASETSSRPIAAGSSLSLTAGQTIRTAGSFDAAEVVYDDGTTLGLTSDTEVTLSRTNAGAKHIHVAAGLIQADVAPQPEQLPLQITTSVANLEVLGTTLGIDVSVASTQLEVSSGLVAMTRRADGKRVHVAAGHLATATRSTTTSFDSQPFPVLASRWSEDFRDGLPDGWSAGKWIVTKEGPAVLAAGDGRGTEDNIAVTTHNAWRAGQHALVSLRDDSVMHIRFRQSKFAPLRLMLVTRHYPPRVERAGVNLYYEDPSWNLDLVAGQWRTISIPLADVTYFGKRGNFRSGKIQLDGLAAFMIQLTTMDNDIGLTVDRMWVTDHQDPEMARLLNE